MLVFGSSTLMIGKPKSMPCDALDVEEAPFSFHQSELDLRARRALRVSLMKRKLLGSNVDKIMKF